MIRVGWLEKREGFASGVGSNCATFEATILVVGTASPKARGLRSMIYFLLLLK